MADTSSDYPAAIDPQPPTLEDERDFVPANALSYAVNQVDAIAGELGTDPVDFTAIGGVDYGTIGAFLLACSRIEMGTITLADSRGGGRVHFTDGRFTAPPFVKIQYYESGTGQPGQYDHYWPKRIRTDGFTVGSGYANRSSTAGKTVWWIAIQPPFGFEQSVEEDED
jgi:hypothetical protein